MQVNSAGLKCRALEFKAEQPGGRSVATALAAVAIHSDFKSKTNVFSSRFGPHRMFPQLV